MNRLVIVGNGFDLFNNLKTDYKSFLDWFIAESLRKAEYNPYEDGNFKIPSLTQTDILNGSPYTVMDVERIAGELKEKGFYKGSESTIGKIHIKVGILKDTLSNINNYGWADIEQIYYKRLIDCLKEDNEKLIISKIDILNKSFSEIRNGLIAYLKQLDKPQKPFFSNLISNPIDDRDFRSKDKTPLKFAKKVGNNKYPNRLLFLNFNYTNYWSDYVLNYRDPKSIPEIINIHGELNNEGLNSPFFGYGDDLDKNYEDLEYIANSDEWSKFFKTIFYQNMDNYKKVLDFLDSNPFQVVIVGHSCGLSDKTLLNKIFEHKNCFNIKPYFYKNEETGEDNWHSLMTNIVRIFAQKERMREVVVSRSFDYNVERDLSFKSL